VASSLGAFKVLPILGRFRIAGAFFWRKQDGDFTLGLGGGFQFSQSSVKNAPCLSG
jgi:hypothetical protein